MSIDEYYKSMGVKHDKDCLICKIDKREREQHRSFISRLWQKAWFIWFLVFLLLVVAYYGSYWLVWVMVSTL